MPDVPLRALVRGAVANRLLRERFRAGDPLQRFAAARSRGPIATETATANDQHYEVPPEFFELILGPRLKYSSCLWTEGVSSLAEAEEAMLAMTCDRAEIENRMRILDLGCGWGSLTLWMAERYPDAEVTAVSNSALQCRFIQERAPANVEVVRADVSSLRLSGERFDRVVSVEMFEHMRNHAALLERIAPLLNPGGALFVHVFAHRHRGYEFGETWMARRFFSGGVMPVHGWLARVPSPLDVTAQWWLDGGHYAKTGAAWLANFDSRRDAVAELFDRTYGPQEAQTRLREWRLFLLACEEIFAFRDGLEYGVSHVLLS